MSDLRHVDDVLTQLRAATSVSSKKLLVTNIAANAV